MNPSTQDQSRQGLGIKTLVLFDTETTGLPSPGNKSRIIELCFVALLKDELLSNYSEIRVMNKLLLCFNPYRRIGPGSSEITGLYNDALEAYGPFKSQANLVSSFLKSLPQPACLIAHNGISFDFPLLVSEFKRAKEELPSEILCADSLEAFRELDGLPRIPDYVLKRKHNCSPQKANNLTVSDARPGECPDKSGEQESPRKQPRPSPPGEQPGPSSPREQSRPLSPREQPRPSSPRKQLRPSSGEVNGWLIEEKTPEKRKYADDAINRQHLKCVLDLTDPSSNENGDCTTSDLLELLDCECIQVCRCKLKPVTCTDKGDVLSPTHDNEKREDELPPHSYGENNNVKLLPLFPSNESPGSVKAIQQKKKVSYSLPNMYQRLFGQVPDNIHTAESDCLTLLKVIRCRKKEFYKWCNRNAVRLSTIEPMH